MATRLRELNREELRFLERKIGGIDLQEGCPVRCITCGLDAPQYKGSMSWKDFKALSEDIAHLRENEGVELFDRSQLSRASCIYPFRASEPTRYLAQDGTARRTLKDVIDELNQVHEMGVFLTTSGWKPGSNYMQEAMERIVASPKKVKHRISLTYSFKTVTAAAIKEYARIKDGKGGDAKSAQEAFIHGSDYAQQLIENMKLLKELPVFSLRYAVSRLVPLGPTPIYSLQYLPNQVLESPGFPQEHRPHKELFSKHFLRKLFQHCTEEAGFTVFDWFSRVEFTFRYFGGYGRAITLGMAPHPVLAENQSLLRQNLSLARKGKRFRENFSAAIEADGTLRIYFGPQDDLTSLPVPGEYLDQMAEILGQSKGLHSHYKTLAGLQGKQLLKR